MSEILYFKRLSTLGEARRYSLRISPVVDPAIASLRQSVPSCAQAGREVFEPLYPQ